MPFNKASLGRQSDDARNYINQERSRQSSQYDGDRSSRNYGGYDTNERSARWDRDILSHRDGNAPTEHTSSNFGHRQSSYGGGDGDRHPYGSNSSSYAAPPRAYGNDAYAFQRGSSNGHMGQRRRVTPSNRPNPDKKYLDLRGEQFMSSASNATATLNTEYDEFAFRRVVFRPPRVLDDTEDNAEDHVKHDSATTRASTHESQIQPVQIPARSSQLGAVSTIPVAAGANPNPASELSVGGRALSKKVEQANSKQETVGIEDAPHPSIIDFVWQPSFEDRPSESYFVSRFHNPDKQVQAGHGTLVSHKRGGSIRGSIDNDANVALARKAFEALTLNPRTNHEAKALENVAMAAIAAAKESRTTQSAHSDIGDDRLHVPHAYGSGHVPERAMLPTMSSRPSSLRPDEHQLQTSGPSAPSWPHSRQQKGSFEAESSIYITKEEAIPSHSQEAYRFNRALDSESRGQMRMSSDTHARANPGWQPLSRRDENIIGTRVNPGRAASHSSALDSKYGLMASKYAS